MGVVCAREHLVPEQMESAPCVQETSKLQTNPKNNNGKAEQDNVKGDEGFVVPSNRAAKPCTDAILDPTFMLNHVYGLTHSFDMKC